MANALDIDLEDKVVIFAQRYLRVPATEHPFHVNGAGFGCKPYTTGSALSGTFLSDGESARMEGYMVERLASEEEIEAARAVSSVANDPDSPFFGLVQSEEK